MVLLKGGTKQVFAEEARGERDGCAIGQQAGGHEFPLEGHGFFRSREISASAVEDVKIGNRFDTTVAAIKTAKESRGNYPGGNIQIACTGEHFGQALAILRLVTPGACFVQRRQQPRMIVAMFTGETLGDHEDFLDVTRCLGRAPGGAPAGAGADRGGVPRLAGAVAVDGARGEIPEHLGRGHHHDADIALRINSACAQPVAQEQVVRGKGEDDAERHPTLATPRAYDVAQRGGVAHALGVESLGQRDGVTIQI